MEYWVAGRVFNEEAANHVLNKIGGEEESYEWDIPWWILNSTGKFIVKSAWDCVRENIEVTGVPCKVFFLVEDVKDEITFLWNPY